MRHKSIDEAKRRPSEAFRFVVTGNDARGRSYFVRDEFVSTAAAAAAGRHLFETTPQQLGTFLGMGNEGDIDEVLPPYPLLPDGWGAHEMAGHHGGVLSGYFELPPLGSEPWEGFEYGATIDRSFGEAGWRYGFHRHRTIDYDVVTAGEFWLYLDEGEVFLRPGDVVVQRNTNHSWQRHGYEGTCSFVGTLIMVHGGRLPEQRP